MEEFLIARVDSALETAQKGAPVFLRFFDPQQQYETERRLQQRGLSAQEYCFFGGYAEAERKIFCALPTWCCGDLSLVQPNLTALQIQGSTFVPLTHSACLGSLLAQGITRDSIGDIVMVDDFSAVVFCIDSVAQFLLQNPSPLRRVGKDTVRVRPYTVPADFSANRKTKTITDTIAAPRLDCVVASLCRMSRQKAKTIIETGRVRLNFSPKLTPDTALVAGDILSIQGEGRFVIQACQEMTKKGRIRLCALHSV